MTKNDYWALARKSGKVIATWPQWKQDYHNQKKAERAIRVKEREPTDLQIAFNRLFKYIAGEL